MVDRNRLQLVPQGKSVKGQACTNGQFSGVCGADGRCGLNIPPNELSRQFVAGQCGR
ncbi:hypothetical protein GCG54_00010106 [Colletotrichum gloeosporioides]|uniref:Uncharacterized protein n=1 Tax=Colletotrichum gloeosporioides TaxID=474922 RepID=A0A8H4C9X7_COLGL|nr:uncharacterized protein GCG54_00010106 [Colletotrichum gloeosporioides]KAF3799912.1 hypothetical protein GCG54_00010106 [Colletotrichum gloeosporioides]